MLRAGSRVGVAAGARRVIAGPGGGGRGGALPPGAAVLCAGLFQTPATTCGLRHWQGRFAVTRLPSVVSLIVTGTGLDRLPTRGELAAYRAFLRAHARVTRCLEGDLIGEQRLTLAAYDVLHALADAPEYRLRMTELADAVLLSRSGVTRLVDRLERIALVHRVRVDSDGRGVLAVITDEGLERLRTASTTHLGGVMRYFLSVTEPQELEQFARTCEKLAAGGVPAPPGQRAQA